MVQLVRSSDNIAPRKPKRAPEAPTEMLVLIKRDETRLPPNPEKRYITPIRTEKAQRKQLISVKYLKLSKTCLEYQRGNKDI